ncbi:MAG: response regulator transcription factor [Ignavibacteria bacterium]|nr:response regulator transcription factor [Ignavibacteria bacterium]
MKYSGEADNGQTALDLIINLKPDIVLLDIDMPKKNGLEVLRELNKLKNSSKIIFLTVYADEDFYDEGVELGISGYVLKDSAISEIIECIYKVNDNKYYISSKLSDLLIKKNHISKRQTEESSLTDRLTKSEVTILKLIAEGHTTKEISEMLDISFKTAENHRTNISTKLELKGTNSLVKFAIENRSHL